MPFQERREVDRVAQARWRHAKFAYWALALACTAGLYVAVHNTQKTTALAHQFCDRARTDRRILEQQQQNTIAYLKSPAGLEHTGLNDYIRQFSVPQLKKRLKTEVVPPACNQL